MYWFADASPHVCAQKINLLRMTMSKYVHNWATFPKYPVCVTYVTDYCHYPLENAEIISYVSPGTFLTEPTSRELVVIGKPNGGLWCTLEREIENVLVAFTRWDLLLFCPISDLHHMKCKSMKWWTVWFGLKNETHLYFKNWDPFTKKTFNNSFLKKCFSH